MKYLIPLFLFLILLSCREDGSYKFEYDVDMEIVAINYETKLSNDKFHTPQLCNTILFKTKIDGIEMFREFNTCNKTRSRKIYIDNEWIYNHNVGDIVHFDYLLKLKFFKITNKEFLKKIENRAEE